MLGTTSASGSESHAAAELAERCRDVRERLTAIAQALAALRAELDDALEPEGEASDSG